MNVAKSEYLSDLVYSDYITLIGKQFFSERVLSVKSVKDGIVLPLKYDYELQKDQGDPIFGMGGVITPEFNYVEESGQYVSPTMHHRICGKYPVSSDEVEIKDCRAIYLNFFIHQWGHFLLDVIGRIWYAINIDRESCIVYSNKSGENDPIAGNYLSFLELAGIDSSRLIRIDRPTQFKEIIIPESSILPGEYYTQEYVDIFRSIKEKTCAHEVNKERKLYLSREKIIRKTEMREDVIEKIFLKNGYEPIYMEQMDLVDQIRTLNSASEIACVTGSLSHNLLFLCGNANVTLINKTYRLNIHQFMINQICDAAVTYVDAYLAPLPILYGMGPFILLESDTFQNWCKDHGFIIPEEEKFINLIPYLLRYYLYWAWIYKGFLLTGRKIRESNTGLFEKSFKEIRENYKKQIFCLKVKNGN